jgi:hypothetical protein
MPSHFSAPGCWQEIEYWVSKDKKVVPKIETAQQRNLGYLI